MLFTAHEFKSTFSLSPFTFPEGYSSPQGDHSPSLLVPPTMPISSCPLSSVPTSTQTKPHLLNPLSGRDQPQPRLKLAKECPQSTKASNGSLSTGRTRLVTKQTPPVPSLSTTKQKRVSRRRATNGWRPVGMPTEREVFIAVGYCHRDVLQWGCVRDHRASRLVVSLVST